ncbi:MULTISPECIES: hypothetical protein [unclassified Paenibacillus]|uniref:hypothetical protein n=1 Tax=unclassified Paenibacillus TaxID=185978 RepID=UPI00362CCD6D
MAKDGLLGKDLTISFIESGGTPFKIETEKFDEEHKTEEKKKHPLGDSAEHTRVVHMGWELSVDGEIVDPTVDDLIDRFEQAYRSNTRLPQLEVRTKEVFADGTVRQWKFSSDGGVRISGFKKTADKGNEARKYSFKIHAMRRDQV